MALIFPRLARNFIKNGYFPTDEATIERLTAMLVPPSGSIRVLDTCCGEGTALAEVAHALRQAECTVTSVGIEFDVERAGYARTILDQVLHADFMDCSLGQGQFNLLWLNPPYGDRLTDQVVRDATGGRDRLEKIFLSKSLPALAFGGVLIYIVPHYALDRQLAKYLARNLEDLAVYRLPEDQFKQVVVMGYRRRSETRGLTEMTNWLLDVANDRDSAPLLPELPDRRYHLRPLNTVQLGKLIEVRTAVPTAELIEEVKQRHPCLWPQFATHFHQVVATPRRPARALSPWHLALMLAAGQVSGVVKSDSGRELLVKGATHKEKELSVEISEDDDGNIEEKRILIDRFVPIIKAIDVTPGSPVYGDILTIR